MLENHVLHACTWLIVRALPWRVGLPVVTRLARAVPPFASIEEGRQSFLRLRGGTCLTRALATSVRLPGSEITFGVRREGTRVRAHAWVSVGGQPLVPDATAGTVISSVDLAEVPR